MMLARTLARKAMEMGMGSRRTLLTAVDTRQWTTGGLTRSQILNDVPSTPSLSPSYPHGPYRFNNREYLIVSYETTPEALRRAVPQPLIPNADNVVLYEWIKMPDSSGFGDYQESGTVIPCTLPDGRELNYVAQMFLDCEPPIACGREIWGFPKKFALPKLSVNRDTICGTLTYADQQIALGSMAYKYSEIPKEEAKKSLQKLSCNLKIIPDYDLSGPAIAQLVGYRLEDIEVLGAWKGPARLHLRSSVNAPTSDLPIVKTLSGKHIIANLTLPYGEVLHDYKNPSSSSSSSSSSNTRAASSLIDIADEQGDFLTEAKVMKLPSMPAMSPSYPLKTPYLQNREMLTIVYETTPEAIHAVLPDILEADPSNRVVIQWSNTEGTGLGAYSKCSLQVLCRLKQSSLASEKTAEALTELSAKSGPLKRLPASNGMIDATDLSNSFLFSVLNIVDCSSTSTIGREIYGQPQKYGSPKLAVSKDTLCATVKYGDQEVARASMTYKHEQLDRSKAYSFLETKEVNLKLIPDVNGSKSLAQLVGIKFEDINIRSAYKGPVRLDFTPHVNAPFSDLPVVNVVEGAHILADLRMSKGHLLHDYLV